MQPMSLEHALRHDVKTLSFLLQNHRLLLLIYSRPERSHGLYRQRNSSWYSNLYPSSKKLEEWFHTRSIYITRPQGNQLVNEASLRQKFLEFYVAKRTIDYTVRGFFWLKCLVDMICPERVAKALRPYEGPAQKCPNHVTKLNDSAMQSFAPSDKSDVESTITS
jgi:hypothetical protein